MDSGSGGGKEAATAPLLDKKPEGLLSRFIDVAEAKEQAAFALPMILTNFAYYFIPLVSVMFAGHLGELELAGSNLANSWAAVTGFSFMVTFFSPTLDSCESAFESVTICCCVTLWSCVISLFQRLRQWILLI